MADAERYLTTDEVRGELPFDAADFPVQSDAQFDSALTRALDSASTLVESWSDTVYATETMTATLARPAHVPEHDLPLPERPVQSVASVTATVRGTEHTLVEDDDYVVEDTHLELVAEPASGIDAWPTERRSVTVEWTYGYESPPEPVREAIIRLTRNALDQIETDGINTESSWQYRPPAKLKRECAQMVNTYDAPSYYGGAASV